VGHQETIFLEGGEGDNWHWRNRHKDKIDPVFEATQKLGIKPRYVLEIGCGTGWRLAKYAKIYKSYCCGIDPSFEAIKEGIEMLRTASVHRFVELYHGTASNDINETRPSDLLVLGFCLYVCDPENLPKIVCDTHNNLIDGGHLIIHDFDPEYPHKVPYHHVDGLFSYKMDYSKLWLANPAYFLVSKTIIGDGTAVWILKKDIIAGWPLEQLT